MYARIISEYWRSSYRFFEPLSVNQIVTFPVLISRLIYYPRADVCLLKKKKKGLSPSRLFTDVIDVKDAFYIKRRVENFASVENYKPKTTIRVFNTIIIIIILVNHLNFVF